MTTFQPEELCANMGQQLPNMWKSCPKPGFPARWRALWWQRKMPKRCLGFLSFSQWGYGGLVLGLFINPRENHVKIPLKKWHFKMALGPQFQTKKHESTIRLGFRGIQIWPRPNWIQRPAGNHLLVSGWIYGLKHQVHSSTLQTQTGPAHIAWGNPTYPHTWVEVDHGVPMVQGIIVRVQSIILWSNYMKSN